MNEQWGKFHGWQQSPPHPDLTPFYSCWVTNGKHVFMARWRNGEWEIGRGLAFTPDEITHFQLLKAPPPPVLIQESQQTNNEVNYA